MARNSDKVIELAAQRDEWEAPAHLSKAAAAVWREVVGSVSPEHFVQSDLPLLSRFCEAEARARKLAQAEAKAPAVITNEDRRAAHKTMSAELSRLRNALASMTRQLRLGPSSREGRGKRTELPTRSPQRASKKPGDDLFAC